MPDFRGPCLSTKPPMNAADVHKKKMAKLKAKETCDCVQPKASLNGSVKTLQAYAEPIDI